MVNRTSVRDLGVCSGMDDRLGGRCCLTGDMRPVRGLIRSVGHQQNQILYATSRLPCGLLPLESLRLRCRPGRAEPFAGELIILLSYRLIFPPLSRKL